MSTEVPPGDPWHASLSSCSVGWLAELVGSTASLEDSGTVSELVGSVAELLDSSADEMASMSELLTGSWLRGMSMELLELLSAVSAGLELSTWQELAGACSWLEGSGVLSLLDDRMISCSSGATSPPSGPGVASSSSFAEELSSQALSASDALIPRAAAMALLVAKERTLFWETLRFSIFTLFPPLRNINISDYEGIIPLKNVKEYRKAPVLPGAVSYKVRLARTVS
jgi:hypothetical protein